MKIDTAIRDFSEKYDRTAIESIDRISKDFSLTVSRQTIKVFNINECFDLFREYIEGYGDYKIKNIDNKEASPREVIQESVAKFIDNNLVKEVSIKYPELPSFVESYVHGVESLIKAVDSVKDKLLCESVDDDSVGDVNDYVDHFMNVINESFDKSMDRILWASGYNGKYAPHKSSYLKSKPNVDFI